AVHQAIEKGAMCEAEHVPGLVREHFATAAQQQPLVIGGARFAVKRRVVARKTVNTDTFAQGCLSEHKIPRRLGVKIFHRDCKQTERVRRNAHMEKVEHVTGKNLRVSGERIATLAE